MNVQRDFLPRLKVQDTKDETLSYTGKPDFSPDDTASVKTLSPRGNIARPRSRASLNNSYS